jgi:hypothetical protein
MHYSLLNWIAFHSCTRTSITWQFSSCKWCLLYCPFVVSWVAVVKLFFSSVSWLLHTAFKRHACKGPHILRTTWIWLFPFTAGQVLQISIRLSVVLDDTKMFHTPLSEVIPIFSGHCQSGDSRVGLRMLYLDCYVEIFRGINFIRNMYSY